MRVALHPDVLMSRLPGAQRELSVLISDLDGTSHQMSRIRDVGASRTDAVWFVSHETVILRFGGPSQSCMDMGWPIWRDMGQTEETIRRLRRAAGTADSILSVRAAARHPLDPVMLRAAILLQRDGSDGHVIPPTPWSDGAMWNETTGEFRPIPKAMTEGAEPYVELHVDTLGNRVRITMTYDSRVVPDIGMDQRLRIIGSTPPDILRIAEEAMRGG